MKKAEPTVEKTVIMYAVYDKPTDYPKHYVCRKLKILPNQVVRLEIVAQHQTLAGVRGLLQRKTSVSVCLPRTAKDDPKIVETWM